MTETRLFRGEVVFAGLLTLVGVGASIQSLIYGLMDDSRLGPGAAPFIAGIALAITGGLSTARAVRAARAEIEEASLSRGGSSAPELSDPDLGTTEEPSENLTRRAMTLFGLMAVMLLMGRWIGLLLASIAFVLITLLFVERAPVRRSIAAATVTGVIIWAIFVQLLDIRGM